MEQPSMTDFQAVELIRNQMEEIPIHRVYYTMKQMRIKPVTPKMVKRMRGCLSIHLMGLPITTRLLGEVLNRPSGGLPQPLHNLGDKNCLVLKRGSKRTGHEWVVHPVFMRHYNGEIDDAEER